jgi:RNA polymerase sigma-70 factor (ECF subfamily)
VTRIAPGSVRAVTADPVAFESHRAHLLGVGYRITGSLADAEDAVQEAWLRFAAQDAGVIDEPRAWLTTVVGRLCLDRLRSAAVRRERYVGPWLPEPLVTTPGDDDPLAVVVRDEGVRMAAMLVLERLSPPQRVAFVLHDALDLPFGRIAEVLDCSEATARQHASRARRIVAEADAPPRATDAEQQGVLAAFADALARADTDRIVALLHPEVVMLTDSGGNVSAARRPIVGPADVTRLLLGLLRKYGDGLVTNWSPVVVNGELGVRTEAVGKVPASVVVLSITNGRIRGVFQVLSPDKL